MLPLCVVPYNVISSISCSFGVIGTLRKLSGHFCLPADSCTLPSADHSFNTFSSMWALKQLFWLLLLATIKSLASARVLVQAGDTASSCPHRNLDTVKDFDLRAYIAAPWYSVWQVEVDFQRGNSFYCTRARYIPEDTNDLKKGINVVNYANQERVNGPAIGVTGAAGNASFSLFGVQAPTTGPTAASKLLVGPKQFLTAAPAAAVAQRLNAPNGNYRVVAVGPSKDQTIKYDWAIIIGGAEAPSDPTGNGLCGPSEAKDEGFWLFHRNPFPPQSDIDLMKQTAKDLGIDTGRLKRVEHKGCKYEGADPAGFAAGGSSSSTASASNSSGTTSSTSSSSDSPAAARSDDKSKSVTITVTAVSDNSCNKGWFSWLKFRGHNGGC